MVYNPRKIYAFRKRFKYKIKYKAKGRKVTLNVGSASVAIKSLTLGWISPSNLNKIHLIIKQKFKKLKNKRRLSRSRKRRFSFFFFGEKRKTPYNNKFLKYVRRIRRRNRKRRLGKITTHLICYLPFTKRSKLVRMGKGKGKFSGWKSPIWCGSIFFQVCETGLNNVPKNMKTLIVFSKIKGRISGRLNLIFLRLIK